MNSLGEEGVSKENEGELASLFSSSSFSGRTDHTRTLKIKGIHILRSPVRVCVVHRGQTQCFLGSL